jgi:hypothetical protein
MKFTPRIECRLANNAKSGDHAPRGANHRRTQSLQNAPRVKLSHQRVTVDAHPDSLLNSAPKSPFRPHSKPQNAKDEKVKTRNEVNLTSDNYGALSVLIPSHPSRLWLLQKKMFSPSEPNLSRARPLDTLLLYVSDTRRPASPSSPSGDQSAAAPGLTRFCKSNERTPAAKPAGFFIPPRPVTRGLRS